MPTTFTNNFQGGNPKVSGAGQHHNPVDGRKETLDATYLNRIENAIETTQSALNTIETRINSIMDVIQDASGSPDGSYLLGPSGVHVSGLLPSTL